MNFNFSTKKILVYGDIIFDKYIFGDVNRISPEAPVPIVKQNNIEIRLGGAANVANNIANVSGDVILCGVLGHNVVNKEIDKYLYDKYILEDKKLKTIIKTRVIAHEQQVLRIDEEDEIRYTKDMLQKIGSFISNIRIDGIIVSDYGKGTVNNKILNMLKKKSMNDEIPIIIDPKKLNYHNYYGVDIITPNLKEAQEMCNCKLQNNNYRKIVDKLLGKYNVKNVIVTLGSNGVCGGNKEEYFYFPAISHNIYDVCGAGDTFIAFFTMVYLQTGDFKLSVMYANIASSIVIEKIGTSLVEKDEFIDRMRRYL